MNIGIYTPNYPEVNREGGIGTYTRNLARFLAGKGHAVHVLTIGDNDLHTMDGMVHIQQCKVSYLRVVDRIVPGTGAMLKVNYAAHRLAHQYKLDVFEFANWDGFGTIFAYTRRIPLVVRLSTSTAETQKIEGLPPSRHNLWDCRREYVQARKADILVTHSRAHRQTMCEELAVPEGSIRVVPLAVPLQEEESQNSSRSSDTPLVLSVGRMEQRKGTLDLMRAVPDILKSCPDTRFVFIGQDRSHCPGNRTHAQFLADEFSSEIQAHIHLLGRLPDDEVNAWMKSATLFVAPSLYESFGLVFLEAMRWRTAVIGTSVGGIPEIVESGKSGILVCPSQPKQLAQAVISLLQNPLLRHTLGEEGFQRVARNFSIEMMGENSIDVYQEAIKKWPKKR